MEIPPCGRNDISVRVKWRGKAEEVGRYAPNFFRLPPPPCILQQCHSDRREESPNILYVIQSITDVSSRRLLPQKPCCTVLFQSK